LFSIGNNNPSLSIYPLLSPILLHKYTLYSWHDQ
jgi:hypothetical protein